MQQKLNINIKNNTKLSNLFIFDNLHNSVLRTNDSLMLQNIVKVLKLLKFNEIIVNFFA